MTAINETKVNELLENKEFQDKCAAVKSAEELVQLLADYGTEVSLEDVCAAMATANGDEELTEDALEAVAGGVIKGPIYWIGYLIGKAVSKSKGVCFPV